jgi:hypothetical protein
MINDLIDLYFHIKSTETLRDLHNWHFTVHENLHLVEYSNVMSPYDGNLIWRFKLYNGTEEEYSTIFLLRTKIVLSLCNSSTRRIDLPFGFTFDILKELNNYISRDEITIIIEIYNEMQKLTERSEVHEVWTNISNMRY